MIQAEEGRDGAATPTPGQKHRTTNDNRTLLPVRYVGRRYNGFSDREKPFDYYSFEAISRIIPGYGRMPGVY